MITKLWLLVLLVFLPGANGQNESDLNADEKALEKVANFTCGVKWSCRSYENSLNSTSQFSNYLLTMNCFCDPLCSFFQDCCTDASSTDKQRDTNQSMVPKELITCMKINEVTHSELMHVVTRCPATWTGSEVKSKCEKRSGSDLLLQLTVTGTNTGFMYRNMYCAICHNTEFYYWNPTVYCNLRLSPDDARLQNATFVDALESPGCYLKYLPPRKEIHYRPCLPTKVGDTCRPDFNDSRISERCENSDAFELVYSPNNAWRNPYCAACNFETNFSCYKGYRDTLHRPAFERPRVYSFSILIDMNSKRSSSTVGIKFIKVKRNITEVHTCRHSEVYDPFSLRCRAVVCDAPLIYVNGLCRTNRSVAGAGNHTDCPRTELNENDFTILEDDSLLERATGRRYAEWEYFFQGSSAFVCSNLTQNYTNTTTVEDVEIVFNFSVAEAVVSVAGLVISLVALVLTIVTYASIKSLHNIPGKNLLSLSVSLFVAELLMLIAPSAEPVFFLCKSVAILMHYFFLVAFFWMNVMAADVWFTFSNSFVKAGGDSGKSSRRFSVYSIYSWGAPCIILISSLTADSVLLDSRFKPNYGLGLCWFTNKNSLMVFFAAPLFLIILMNMGFFAIASKNIYEARKSSARHLQTNENSRPFLYMKLFFVMGLTWFVGFLASLVSRPVLWYLFAILNTLQGFFIFLSFVATKKVVNLIRERLTTLRRGQTSESNLPSSPTKTTFVPFRVISDVQV